MNKRRRASSVTGRGADEDESDSQHASEPNRKKKKLDPMEMAQQLYDIVRNYKKDDGSLLCDSFIRAPKRRQEPAYYEVVQNPIDLLKVQQKLKTEEYDDIDDLCSDLELLVNNSKSFYKRNTQEYKDAVELWDLVQTTKAKILDESKVIEDEPKGKILLKMFQTRKSAAAVQETKQRDDNEDTSESSSVTNDDEITMCEELFNIIMTATSDDSRPLHPAFQLLPSKKRYPNYYDVIEQPIDLRLIARRIQDNKYTTISEMEKDLLVLTKNACVFNEPGSQIYRDAKALRKLTQAKKVELEQGKIPISKEKPTRGKRARNAQSHVAMTASLKSDDEEDEEEGTLCDGEEDQPSWQLFNTVKNCTNPQGELMSEPFYRLPSKRIYPDYYEEIRNPIALTQICRKLQKGHYDTVSEVAGDLNIMFENAKKYNRPDSKLYKCAVKLQKIMQKRFQELLEVDNQYSESEDDSMDEPPRKLSSGGSSPMMSGKPPSKLLTRGKYLDNIPLKQGSDTPPVPTVKSEGTPYASKVLTKGKYLDNIPLKKRIYCLCNTLIQYVCEDGRQPMLMFMEKPSAKLYPDYYEVIEQPIDMLTIQANIRAEKYQSEEDILADFKLMFKNCRKYNEIGSMIYEDATKLEKILLDKVKELGPLPPNTAPKIPKPATPGTPTGPKLKPGRPPGSANSPNKHMDTSLSRKLRTLYHSVRDYRDPKGRQLSQIFVKLPSKTEYPDYYEVIKKPINLEQISQKAKSGIYESLDDLCADFILMFDNACKYNEPDSQIYKDALTLQRVTMQTKLQLRQDESGVPDVRAAVQELLHSLFTSVYNHQDEEGRCFSDSMQELPEHDEIDGKKVRGLSLDLIKRRLDSGQYRRLDTFQEDMFSCFLRARSLSRSDSQVFEDSIELQSYFIRQRDELCKNGDFLSSPALSFTLLDLSTAVDQQRHAKQANEQPDDENSVDIKLEIKEEGGSGGSGMAGVADNALSYNQQVYRIGDFVYAEGNEKGMEPIILNIQRLWTNQEGSQMLYGNQYYRPNETYHVTTRRFLEKEVFKTDQNLAIPLNQVLGRCCIMSVKDYFRFKPENVEDKDVYVCESRYSSRARSFKKIKNWPPSLMTGYKLVLREEVLEPKRVMSVFRQRVEKHMEEISELEELEKLVEKPKPNVELKEKPTDNSWTYYEQYNAPNCLIKTGDCVYIKSDAGRQLIALIDTIWTSDEGAAFFRGPWVVSPSELPPSILRNPFKQEVYLSTLEDTHSINNILGKCAILEHSDYVSSRPTEVAEKDVFLCENVYDEAKRVIRELGREGLKKYPHSKEVLEDEIYYFKRIISLRNTPKATTVASATVNTESVVAVAPLALAQNPISLPSTPIINHYENSVDSDVIMEDSMDGPPPSVSSDTSIVSTPTTSTKKSSKIGTGKKLVTGYILYSGEVRKGITQSHPKCNFGEVSRLVGNEWRKLSASEKASWEEKAAQMNEENQNDPPSASQPLAEHILVFECCWHDCDWQFEDMADAIEHACNDSSGHVYQFFAPIPPNEAEYQCHWRGCCRTTKKTIPPFPNLHRLARHVREVHLLKSNGKSLHPDNKSKHFLSSRKAAAAALQAAAQAAKNPPLVQGLSVNNQNNTGNMVGANGRVFEPMFVTVPPRPQKLLHSEAYIKYIEGLTPENRNVSSWDRQLSATQSTVEPADKARLPAHWLGNGVGNHGNILNALWTLRDFMFRDALGISKHL